MIWHVWVIVCQSGAFPQNGNIMGNNDNDSLLGLGLDKPIIYSSVFIGQTPQMARLACYSMIYGR